MVTLFPKISTKNAGLDGQFLRIIVIWLLLLAVSVSLFAVVELYAYFSWEKVLFVELSLGMLVYLIWELFREHSYNKHNYFLSPAVLASIVTFILSFVLGNFFFISDDAKYELGWLGWGSPYPWMNKAVACAFIGAFMMWRGYRLQASRRLGRRLRAFLLRRGFLRTELNIRWPAVFLLLSLSIYVRFLQARLGIFGYSAELTSLHRFAAYKQWLDMATTSSRLILVVVALAYFSKGKRTTLWIKALFWSVLFMEVGFGFLSGFKGQTVFPIIVVGMIYYIFKRKLPWKWVAVMLLILPLSYQVIEPFREYRLYRLDFQNKDLTEIAEVVGRMFIIVGSNNDEIYVPNVEGFFKQLNLTKFAAGAIAHRDNLRLDETDPQFISRIVMSPLYAYIPRIVWPQKPVSNLGLWYNIKVRGMPENTLSSVGMSPVGYLYLGGGIVAIVIVFWVIGIIQRICFECLTNSGIGAWIVYFGLLYNLVVINSAVDSIFVGLFRFFPILILAQLILLRKTNSRQIIISRQTL